MPHPAAATRRRWCARRRAAPAPPGDSRAGSHGPRLVDDDPDAGGIRERDARARCPRRPRTRNASPPPAAVITPSSSPAAESLDDLGKRADVAGRRRPARPAGPEARPPDERRGARRARRRGLIRDLAADRGRVRHHRGHGGRGSEQQCRRRGESDAHRHAQRRGEDARAAPARRRRLRAAPPRAPRGGWAAAARLGAGSWAGVRRLRRSAAAGWMWEARPPRRPVRGHAR